MMEWRVKFNSLADELQSNMQATVGVHLRVVKETLDMIRSENVALESERNPEFRSRVAREIQNADAQVQRFQQQLHL